MVVQDVPVNHFSECCPCCRTGSACSHAANDRDREHPDGSGNWDGRDISRNDGCHRTSSSTGQGAESATGAPCNIARVGVVRTALWTVEPKPAGVVRRTEFFFRWLKVFVLIHGVGHVQGRMARAASTKQADTRMPKTKMMANAAKYSMGEPIVGSMVFLLWVVMREADIKKPRVTNHSGLVG